MPAKRKRPDRPNGDGGRPSPHRPTDISLSHHEREDANTRGRGRGGLRGGLNRRDSFHGYDRSFLNPQPGQTAVSQRNSSSSQALAQNPSLANTPVSPATVKPLPAAPAIAKPPSSPAQTRPSPSPTAVPTKPLSPAPTRPSPESIMGSSSPMTSNYRYDNLTDEKLRVWAERGRAEIISHGVQSRDDVDIIELSSLFQEFIHAVVENRLNATDAGACVKEILGDETSDVIKDSYAFAPHTLLLDSLAIVVDHNADLYRPSLREFLMATGVSPALMRQVLDAPLLQQLGLIRDTFARLGVRQATNLLYRQANYNLLREETEGYSKLITELFTTSSVTSPSPELAEETFERVKALIGTFDLDVGRVLDVTLDVAAAVLIKQFKFFVKFLRISSWWPRSQLKLSSAVYTGGLPTWAEPGYPQWNTTDEDEETSKQQKLLRDIAFWERAKEIQLAAFFELGGRTAVNLSRQPIVTNGTSGEGGDDLEQQWIEETKTLPPPGNKVAAQLLGFKLLFYNSDLRDKSDVLPANLLYLASLLIKVGFLSLTDLYPHLSPPDKDMERVREEQTKRIEQEARATRGGPMNALLMAGVLPQGDDDNPISSNLPRREIPKKAELEAKPVASESAEDLKALPEPLEQKVRLLVQLLTIGAIPESLFILGRFPWIPELFPDVLSRIHRILHVAVEKVFKDSRPWLLSTTECPTKEVYAIDQSGMAKGSVRLSRLPVKKIWRWPYPDKWDTIETQNNYRFYWDEWDDNIPVCQTVDDIFTLCSTFLNISGVNIGKDETLLSKLASIGAKSLADDGSEANHARWLDLLRRLLVPALSHTKANASVVNLIWDLLKCYPLWTRYSIYTEWFEGQISRLPAMRAAFARATSETRGTMKRVSLTNLSEMAKQLAKTSYSSPGIVFRVAFEQLESYPNLIEAFVECAKYFTDLSYDVLVWSLMSSLGKSRSRTQADHALTTSKWLQALSRFSGKVFKRYPGLNPTPVLQYVNDQLARSNSTDLIILKEFITSMGGIVDAVDFTDYQVLSMAGGERLRRQTLIRGQDKRFDNTKSSKRLIQALTDSKLASRFLLNLAQYRQSAIYQVPEDEAHIKYLSSLVDDSHQTLIQYLDFLWSNLEPASFDTLVPSIPDLMGTFGLDASLAFLIGRASLSHRLYPWGAKEAEGTKDDTSQPPVAEAADKEGDVAMTDSSKPIEEAKDQATQEDQVGDKQPTTSPHFSTNATTVKQKSDDPSPTLAPLQPLVQAATSIMPSEVWQSISPELFVVFWALQLGDLFCPEEMYKNEKDRLESEGQAILKDRSDMSRRGQERRNEKRQELLKLQLSLSMELKEHRQRKGKWKDILTKKFQSDLFNLATKADCISDALLEHCFLPRMFLSQADTEYTYRFIMALHECRAPNFKLMSLYDQFFNANRLRSLIFTSSVREAEFLGRFLRLILKDLSRWHKNDPLPGDRGRANKDQARLGAYDKEARGLSDYPLLGFCLEFGKKGEPETLMDHAQFQDLLFRWHKNLNTALKSCLSGTEWMHIRNAITVLKAVLDFFPAVDFMATQFLSQLQKITKQEAASKTASEGEEGNRVDLSVAAQGAMSELQKRKSKWVMVQAFRPNAAGGPPNELEKNANANLRSSAPDSKPQSSKSPINRQSTAEREDGEVQDLKEGKPQQASGGPTPTGSTAAKDFLPAKPAGPNRELARDDTMSNSPRSSTPMAAGQGSGSFGPRGDQRSHMLPDRPAHTLPTRPDVPIPGHFTPERYGQGRGHDRRDMREPRDIHRQRDSSYPRESWETREPREAKDHRETRDPRDSRQVEADRADRNREYVDRRGPDNVNRDAPPADLPPRPRQDRDWAPRETWAPRAPERANEQQQFPVPPTGPADMAEPVMNPQRAALFAQDETERVVRPSESERAARARRPTGNETVEPAPGNSERAITSVDVREDAATALGRPRDDGRERGPRAQSPRRSSRYGQEHGPSTTGYDDRHARPHAQDNRNGGRNVRDRSPFASTNYRGGDKGSDREVERAHMDKMRETQSAFHRPPSHSQDHEHRPSYQDQNYGRLNPVPTTSDIPSGPRGRGRGTARVNQPQPLPALISRTDGRYAAAEVPRAPSPERHPPSGPANRGRRGGLEHGHGAPLAPSGGTPGGMMHGDRGRSFPGSGTEKPMPPPTNAPLSTAVHPDRLAKMNPSSSEHQGPPPPPPPPGPPPPHGHSRAASSLPGHGEVSEVVVPTGPSSGSGDRPKSGGGGRRQLAGINNTLQQAQAAMPDINRSVGVRNTQSRQMLGHSDIQVLAGGSPGPSPGSERQEGGGWHDSSMHMAMGNNGDGANRSDHERSRRDRDSRSDRSKRPSRRNSREREREGKEHGEHRDRRSLGPTDSMSSSRDDREARRSMRESGGRELTGSTVSIGRESRHRTDGTGGRGGEERGSSRNSRGAPREGALRADEQRRDLRDDRGRKRRSEDVEGTPSTEREKRPRR